MTEDFEIVKSDFLDFLSRKKKFDIIFLDPPYATDFGTIAIEFIIKNDMLNDDGVIVFETSDDKSVELNFKGFNIGRRKYGTVAVYIIRKENENRK